MEKIDVQIEPWLRQAIELYRRHFPLLLLAHLAAAAVSVFTLGILAGPMAAGVASIVLRLLDGREPAPQAGDIFRGFDWFLPSFLLYLTVGAAQAIAFAVLRPLGALAAAPALFIQTATVFAIYFIVERGLDFLSAIRASFDIVRTNFWPMFLLVVIGSLIAGLGGIACGVGIVLTLPVYTLLTAIAWRRISGGSAANAADRIPLGPPRY